MERVRARDVAAFESIYDAYHRLVFGIALKMLQDAMAAEDLTQAVFLKVWSQPERLRLGKFRRLDRAASRGTARSTRYAAARFAPKGDMPVDVPLEGSIDETVFARLDGQRVARGARCVAGRTALPDRTRFFRRRHARRDRASHRDAARHRQNAHPRGLAQIALGTRSERRAMIHDDAMLDSVAVLALGALPEAEALAVARARRDLRGVPSRIRRPARRGEFR